MRHWKLLAILIVAAIFSCVTYNIYDDVLRLEKGESFGHKVFQSPDGKNSVTVMAHIDGAWFNYYSYIYIIPGVYDANRVPEDGNFIGFPESAGVIVEWVDSDNFKIISDYAPLVNRIENNNFSLILAVDPLYFHNLIANGEGKKIIREIIE